MKHTARKIAKQGLFFIIASVLGNILNLIFNFFLGRYLAPVDFALVALFMGGIYATNVFFGALTFTTSHSVGISPVSLREAVISHISSRWKGFAFVLGLIASIIWVVFSPFLADIWSVETTSLFFFLPVFIFGILTFLNRGILQGELRFSASGSIFLAESGMKLIAALAFVTAGLAGWAYVAIPISVFVAYIVSEWCLWRNPSLGNEKLSAKSTLTKRVFPRRFFVFSFLLGLSTLTFLSIDVLLAKAFYSAEDAGAYALIALSGKILFLFSSLLSGMVISVVSNALSENRDTKNIFRVFFSISFLFVFCGTAFFLVFGERFFLFFFGQKVADNLSILPMYILAIAAFSLSHAIVLYHHAKREFIFPILSSISMILLIAGTLFFHDTLEKFVLVLFLVSLVDIVVISVLHLLFKPIAKENVSNRDLISQLSFIKTESTIECINKTEPNSFPTVTIGIPAYNEQHNIGNILERILQQKRVGFVVEKIIVVSDGSTDDTVKIASEYMHTGVQVIPRKENRGLNFTQNEIMNSTTTDILVLLNADILLGDDNVIAHLVSPIINGADLSASWTSPLAPQTFIERVLYAGFQLKYWVYRHYKDGDNIYTCVGHNRALSRRLYKNVIFPLVSDGEDQYLYLSCVNGGYRYKYAGPINAYFKLPNNFSDYKKYAKRIFQTQEKYKETFGMTANAERRLPKVLIVRGCLYGFLKHPFYTPIYIILHVVTQKWALKQQVSESHTFSASSSTKNFFNK